MEIFRQWLSALTIEQLFGMVVSLSATISKLRDTPYCTIRQLEELQNDLDINRILLKLTFEELEQNRELTDEEQDQLRNLLTM